MSGDTWMAERGNGRGPGARRGTAQVAGIRSRPAGVGGGVAAREWRAA
jgi:hypothetical protein